MPRKKPITKMGVFGNCDLNPEEAVALFFESKMNNQYYIKTPLWDSARNGFELKGIQNDREYMEITREQNQMRDRAQRQTKINEKRLTQTQDLLQEIWDEFVELNDFLKDSENKENQALITIAQQQKKHVQYKSQIDELDSDIVKLNDFVQNYEKTIEAYEPFERVMQDVVQEMDSCDTMEELIQRCDSLLLTQVEISAVEQQKIKDIEEIHQNLNKASKTALHIITGLNNDLSELLTQYVKAKEDCLRWEKYVTVAKGYIVESEANVNCLLDAVNNLYQLVYKRRGSADGTAVSVATGAAAATSVRYNRGDIERQLDHIKEEIEILHETNKLAAAKRANDGRSVWAEKGTERKKGLL